MTRRKSGFSRRTIAWLINLVLGFSLALLGGFSYSNPNLFTDVVKANSLSEQQSTTDNQLANQTSCLLLSLRRTTASCLARSSDQDNASLMVQQGRELYQAERFSEAASMWQQAAEVYQTQGDKLNQAMTLNYLALTYQELGEWSQANATIANSFRLLGKNDSSEQLPILAQAFNTQASLQLAQGQAEQALITWQQATAIYTQIDDQVGRVGSLINQAQAQQVLGLYRQARKTLAIVEQTLLQQNDFQIKTTGLLSLGNVFQSLGELDKSQQVLQESLAIAQKLAYPSNITATLLSLGNTARSQKDLEAAAKYYQQAATLSTSPTIQIQAQLNQLSLLLELQRWSDGQTLVSVIETQIRDLPISRSSIYSQGNFAESLLKLRQKTGKFPINFQEIAQLLGKAIEEAQKLKDLRAESYALGNLGKLYEATQQWSIAQQLTEQALLLAQTLNAPDIAYQWQWQLGRILKAIGEIKQATTAYEDAFHTLKSLRSNLVTANQNIEFSFRESVEPVYRELVGLLLQPQPNQKEVHHKDGICLQTKDKNEECLLPSLVNQANLKQARQVIEALQLAELDNFFRSACLEGKIVPIEQIPQTTAAFIYPIILDDRVEVILSLPQKPLSHYMIPVSAEKVEVVLAQLRLNLEKPYTTPDSKSLAQQVYDWLIRPAEADLAQNQIKTLVFILDGSLRNVPMAALYDGKEYLIEKYAIALTPGLQLLNPQPLQQQTLKALLAGLTEERHGFIALPNVSQELATIESEVPSQVLLNQAFTSSSLQNEINAVPFSIVHLATHGQFSSEAAQTFILAWDKSINIDELRALLRSREENQAEAIELLVLSACETASGDKRAALGLAGIAVRSGARSTLASLWNLDDESGARLIAQFYRQLATKTMTKAEALRQAQLSLLRDPDYRYPAQWASYVLVGNWL